MTSNKKPTVLILGAGIGGISAAKELRKLLGDKCRIVLVERRDTMVFDPSLLWLMVGSRRARQISKPTESIEFKGIDMVQGNIEAIIPERRSAIVDGVEYSSDYMIVALGAELQQNQKTEVAIHNFYTLDGAAKFYDDISKMSSGRVAVVVSSMPFKCPAAPYEAALLIESFLRKRNHGKDFEVYLFSPEPGPLPVAGQTLSDQVRMVLERRGIKYYPNHQLLTMHDLNLTFNNGHSQSFDLVAYVPQHASPEVVRNSELSGQNGWIEIDRNNMSTVFQNVFAVGDVTTVPLEIGKPLPKAGVFAHAQALVVARNIASVIEGRSTSAVFEGNGQCFLETGQGKAGYASGNFYASPAPSIKMKAPSRLWHWAKVLFEKNWLTRYM